ncbi:MAG: OmpH family outer membrane protein [SAR324 cluster bacterium]|uniref:OmpH family outer membrane protein n=1 Tax=SAR324 cluster bacterium TaxID=2024889 RepID=A0A7X9FQ72_9DELT|nr:OmpH family outer membrane protein [SAR324 cluster bacterium]
MSHRSHPSRVIIFAFVSFFGISSAAMAASGKILVVDMQRVISESIMGKAAQSDLQAEAKKKEVRLQQRSNQVKEMSEQVEKQASLLSKDALEQKKQEVMKKQKELERSLADERQEMAKMRDSSLMKVVTEAKKVVNEVAAQKGAIVVVEKDPQVVLYVNDELDITPEVLKALDSKKLSQ